MYCFNILIVSAKPMRSLEDSAEALEVVSEAVSGDNVEVSADLVDTGVSASDRLNFVKALSALDVLVTRGVNSKQMC